MGIFRDFSDIRSRGFSFGFLNDNIFGGKVGIAYSEPLRIYQGSAGVNIANGVNQDGSVRRITGRVSLVPSGRQKDLEVYYGHNVGKDGHVSFNAMLQNEVNNVKGGVGYLGVVIYGVRF